MTAPAAELDESYDEIERAVAETARGRWFLAEHARRVRAAETAAMMAAIQRLETRIEALAPQPAIVHAPATPAPKRAPAGSNAPIDVLMSRLATALAETGETMQADTPTSAPASLDASLERLDALTTEERLRLFY